MHKLTGMEEQQLQVVPIDNFSLIPHSPQMNSPLWPATGMKPNAKKFVLIP